VARILTSLVAAWRTSRISPYGTWRRHEILTPCGGLLDCCGSESTNQFMGGIRSPNLPKLRKVVGRHLEANVDKLKAARPDMEIDHRLPAVKQPDIVERVGQITIR